MADLRAPPRSPEADVSRRIVAGYEQMPQQDDGLDRWVERGARDLVAEEPW